MTPSSAEIHRLHTQMEYLSCCVKRKKEGRVEREREREKRERDTHTHMNIESQDYLETSKGRWGQKRGDRRKDVAAGG